jgi:hypothetical protein
MPYGRANGEHNREQRSLDMAYGLRQQDTLSFCIAVFRPAGERRQYKDAIYHSAEGQKRQLRTFHP